MQQPRYSRRFVTSIAALGAASTLLPTGARVLAQSATPADKHDDSDHEHAAGEQQFLAVGDTTAGALHIYALPDLTLVGTIDDVAVQAHAGFLPLANGELLFVDESAHRLVTVGVVDDEAVITHEIALPGTSVSHIAVDSDHGHVAAVGTDAQDSPIFLIDLDAWEGTKVALPEAGEVGLFLTHDNLFHRNDATSEIEAYTLEQLAAGDVTPISTVDIGTGGHGESISADGATLYTATDDGIDVVAWDGEALTYLTTYAWATDDRSGGRGYFQRLSLDGAHVVSYTADRTAPETDWTTWANDVFLANTTTHEVTRTPLGDGYTYRFALTPDAALFYVLGETGDSAVIVDLATDSPTFGQVRATIALDPQTTGPKPGISIYETNQYRSLAATPDGTLGFVSQGGDGIVTVIDLAAGEIHDAIAVPTTLDGGGYLGVFGTAETFTDTIGR